MAKKPKRKVRARKMPDIRAILADFERRIVALENRHADKQMETGGVAGPVGDPTPDQQ